MIQLNNLSKIGFGGYRISKYDKMSGMSLKYAIECGCNLIDTASNYSDGESEKLIGRILKDMPENNNVFVVTKAGYISNSNMEILKKLFKKGKGNSDLVDISDSFKHSIHPDYLEEQLNVSLKRLNRTYIDGFLLHSPEYYFKAKNKSSNRAEYYDRIKMAFEFLEEKVKQGIIRYYGVSSNTLPLSIREENYTDLSMLIRIANQISKTNHFKLIQFPYNVLEQDALTQNENGKSIIEIAKEFNIKTFSNRPLNANSSSGLMRLSINNIDESKLNTKSDDDLIYNDCFDLLENQLRKYDPDSAISDVSIVRFLKENWMIISNPDIIEGAFDKFNSFAYLIFGNKIPKKSMIVLKKFEEITRKHHLQLQSSNTINYLKINKFDHILNQSKSKPLPFILCNEYLSKGIDHVLVGMRKVHYVDELKEIF